MAKAEYVGLPTFNVTEEEYKAENNIRTLIRTLEDTMKTRVRLGNRVAATYMLRMGLTRTVDPNDPNSVRVLQKGMDRALEQIVNAFWKIVEIPYDGEGKEIPNTWILPRPARFNKILAGQANPIITSYSELALVDIYMRRYSEEEASIKYLATVVKEIPLWNYYFDKIEGCGPKIAAAMLSELNPWKARHACNYWSYVGLDVVTIGRYTDSNGEEHIIPDRDMHSCQIDELGNRWFDGFPVEVKYEGRGSKKTHLKYKTYRAKDGTTSIQLSLGHNRWLKSKLMGVLADSFLMQNDTYLDGELSTKKTRMKVAEEYGFQSDKEGPELDKEVNAFLIEHGHDVTIKHCRLAVTYYNPRHRLEQANALKPEEERLTPIVIHWRSRREMMKEFLREVWIVSRIMYRLPVCQSYNEAKLGLPHARNEFLWLEYGIDTSKFPVEPSIITPLGPQY